MKIAINYLVNGVQKRSAALENEDYALFVKGGDSFRNRVTIRAKRPITLRSACIHEDYQYDVDDLLYLNGYQSWTDTREFDLTEEVRNLNSVPKPVRDRFHFKNYGDSWFWKYRKGSLHSYTYGYCVKSNGSADFIGSLNEEKAWLIIDYRKNEERLLLYSDCQDRVIDGEFTLFDFVRYEGVPGECLKRYFAHYGTCGAKKLKGYSSWYLHYQDISEAKIWKALSGIGSDEYDLFQIDDGFETFVGDWLDIDQNKFPAGLTGIVERIHKKGLKAGIWLAPFVCELKSRLYREHPDWVYRVNGRDVFAGCNWSGDVVLDIRKDEVRDYIRTCLRYYADLGFDYFKLDFLYAAALIRDGEMTRAERMREAMVFLRDVLPDSLILGCGVPLSSAFNLVDYCRIGADVSLLFDDLPHMRLMHRERVSTKNTILNTIYRSCMDGTVFRCDPDVYLLRDDRNQLTKEQKKSLVLINHLCGSLYLTSDQVGEYNEDKKRLLERARALTDAKITWIRRKQDLIEIHYELGGEAGTIRYNWKRGILHE